MSKSPSAWLKTIVGQGVGIVNRLRTATPLQVMLKVRIAEMNRTVLKEVGVNLLNRDTSNGGAIFGIGQGSPGTIKPIVTANDPSGLPVGGTAVTFNNVIGGTTLGLFGRILGTDLLGTLDLLQKDGLVTTLAEPNLTALSGETASFLAGGEFPIPVSQSLDAVTIEYKQYGVGLAFTPVVLADGRISMRVRPEVSELSNEGVGPAQQLHGAGADHAARRDHGRTRFRPKLHDRRPASQLDSTNDINKAPFLGDLPILGALFRSTMLPAFGNRAGDHRHAVSGSSGFRSAGACPTDGFRAPSDLRSGARRADLKASVRAAPNARLSLALPPRLPRR